MRFTKALGQIMGLSNVSARAMYTGAESAVGGLGKMGIGMYGMGAGMAMGLRYGAFPRTMMAGSAGTFGVGAKGVYGAAKPLGRWATASGYQGPGGRVGAAAARMGGGYAALDLLNPWGLGFGD